MEIASTSKSWFVPVQMLCLFDQDEVVLQRILIQGKIIGRVCDFHLGLETAKIKSATNGPNLS